MEIAGDGPVVQFNSSGEVILASASEVLSRISEITDELETLLERIREQGRREQCRNLLHQFKRQLTAHDRQLPSAT